MRILAVGGGSGGHVTPVVAVLKEIRARHPRAEIRFWCDKKFFRQASEIIHNFDSGLPVGRIVSGKFRRYNHISTLRQLLMPSIVLRNIRDAFLVVGGFFQSLIRLIFWRPDVVFCKGGYVCLPVGLAAQLLRIPIVIHDSDSHPGLTNRILSHYAVKIATGAPVENYPYPQAKTYYVGIPVGDDFHPFSKVEKQEAKQWWGITESRPLIVITGGGLGAKSINDSTLAVLDDLLSLGSVVLISGSAQYDELRALTVNKSNADFYLFPFVAADMARLLGAADIVVSRAGATFIAELAALEQPTILVPNARLTGGHQLKNASVYQNDNAVVVLDEDELLTDPVSLVRTVNVLMSDRKKTCDMAKRFSSFARPNAAHDMADLILSVAK